MPEKNNAADVNSPCLPYLHNLEPMSEEQYTEMVKRVGATPASLKTDVEHIRDWMDKQPHLPSLSSDYDPWLTRYIICCKNSIQRTKESLDKYFTVRARYPDLFLPGPIGPFDKLFSLITSAPMPKVTPHGTRVVISRYTEALGQDASEMNWPLYFKLTTCMADMLMASDMHPITGELCLDLCNFTVNLNNSFIPHLSGFKQMLDTTQGGIPLHYKAVHLLNAPTLVKALIAMVRPFLKDKLGDRILVHETYDSFHAAVPKEYLPKDYGGTLDKNLEDYCNDWYEIMTSNRPWLEARGWMRADETKRIGGDPNADLYGVEGSFRKLAVD